MKVIALKGDNRENLGKSATKAIRNEGKVPCVVYGGDEHLHFSSYEADFKNLVYTPNSYLVLLDVNGSKKLCKLQDIQFHPVSETIMHADFLQLDTSKPVDVKIPIKLVGQAPGVKAGGRLMVRTRKLTVKGMVADLPDFIEVDISSLTIGKIVRVKNINVANIEFLDTAENPVVGVVKTRVAKDVDEEDGEAAEGEEGGAAEGGEE